MIYRKSVEMTCLFTVISIAVCDHHKHRETKVKQKRNLNTITIYNERSLRRGTQHAFYVHRWECLVAWIAWKIDWIVDGGLCESLAMMSISGEPHLAPKRNKHARIWFYLPFPHVYIFSQDLFHFLIILYNYPRYIIITLLWQIPCLFYYLLEQIKIELKSDSSVCTFCMKIIQFSFWQTILWFLLLIIHYTILLNHPLSPKKKDPGWCYKNTAQWIPLVCCSTLP